MSDRANLCCSYNDDAVRHKGFYNDVNFMKSLGEICYDNFLSDQKISILHMTMQMFYFVVPAIFLQ